MDESPKEKKKRLDREWARRRYANDPEFREKEKAEARAYRLKNADAINMRARVRRYGLSVEEYAAMVACQNGICAICVKQAERGLCIDHDHNTRKPRDLLCNPCNFGLGNYNEDPAAMRRGADYLEYWQQRHADPGITGPSPFSAVSQHGCSASAHPAIQSAAPKREHMTPIDAITEESKTGGIMRRAILHELHRPLDPDELPPAYKLQAVARAVVNKAAQGDLTAAKEILDRIDGRTPTAGALRFY